MRIGARRAVPCCHRLVGEVVHCPPLCGIGGGGWHKASVSDCLPLAMPVGLSPLLILTLCGPERVLVVSTEHCGGGGGGQWQCLWRCRVCVCLLQASCPCVRAKRENVLSHDSPTASTHTVGDSPTGTGCQEPLPPQGVVTANCIARDNVRSTA